MSELDVLCKLATVYFSKDRPMQLDLCLNTQKNCSIDWDLQCEFALYKTSDKSYQKAYLNVQKENSAINFIEEDNFKDDLLDILKDKDYVMFVVDDCIFTHRYSISDIIKTLDSNQDCLGFSLRLGDNTAICYPISNLNFMPAMQVIESGIQKFNWGRALGQGDFSYPLELSSSVYRTKDIFGLLETLEYENPNRLEWELSNSLHKFKDKPYHLCYEKSVAFCNPANKVQTENNNRTGNNPEYSLQELLKKYNDGYRIKNDVYRNFVSNGCHQEVGFEFYKIEENK